MKQLSRRDFISSAVVFVGAGVSTSLLSSCGGGNHSFPDDLQLVARFPQQLVPGNLRLPISLGDRSGLIQSDSSFDFPTSLTAQVVDYASNAIVATNVVAQLHGSEMAVPYYPFHLSIPEIGNYSLKVDGGPSSGVGFSVVDSNQVLAPGVNDQMITADTPTVDDPLGVDPICTLQPDPCPFHQLSLRNALTLGKQVVVLVGTPAHCSTGTCTPALVELMEVANSVDEEIVFIHIDVYADHHATKIAPSVAALNLTFEPALFFVNNTGQVVERLDAVFDASEIKLAMKLLGVN